jgi:superfamily I DNA/RNA helicase
MLLGYGVPAEWLGDVRSATEETLFGIVPHLPGEAAEALLELATGGTPRFSPPIEATVSPFEHPDAQRRFRVMSNVEELARALDFPWDKWTVFLHPEQRQFVEKDFNGPARVTGSAGTGKTIVALHRAAHLARRNPGARVLLTTFSDALAAALQTLLNRLLVSEPKIAGRIDVQSLTAIGKQLYAKHVGTADLAGPAVVSTILAEESKSVGGHKFSQAFLTSEWEQVVDAWQLGTWEAYRDVARLGRKTRLPEAQRKILWSIFEKVDEALASRNLMTEARLFTTLASLFTLGTEAAIDFAVVDEAQDIGVPHLRFLAALGADRPNALFFAGDLGQRIFQQAFSWKSLGVDIRGRSRTLRVNYRTSHQIRSQADRLLGPTVTDVDGNSDDRNDTVSIFNGPPPSIQVLKNEAGETAAVADWIRNQQGNGIKPHEFGVFVRSVNQIPRAKAAAEAASVPFVVLDEGNSAATDHLSISTMHLAKGLEFRAVVVMACDDEVIPLQSRIEAVGDDADLLEVYETERHLLYVACTRARDALLVTSLQPASEFLDDLRA